MDPAAFTPRWIAGLDGKLVVHCAGCREVREVHLRKLIEAGRDKQPIAAMVFRCQVCGQVGRKVVEWRDSGGHWRHDFETGETSPKEKPPGFYDAADRR